MIEHDLAKFTEILDSLSEYYQQKEPLSKMAVKIYFRALSAYPLEIISDALNKHLQDTTNGKFYPKAADLIKHIEGGEIKEDMIIASAKVAETPLGCLARIQIGSWDLGCQDGFYLRQRAAECLLLLPEWKARAQHGNYSDHEISIMLKFNVNPAAPFAYGLAPPANAQSLLDRAEKIKETPRHLQLIEAPHDEENDKESGIHPDVSARLSSILGD